MGLGLTTAQRPPHECLCALVSANMRTRGKKMNELSSLPNLFVTIRTLFVTWTSIFNHFSISNFERSVLGMEWNGIRISLNHEDVGNSPPKRMQEGSAANSALSKPIVAIKYLLESARWDLPEKHFAGIKTQHVREISENFADKSSKT